MRVNPYGLLSLTTIAAAATGLCTLRSGGQDVFFAEPAQTPAAAEPAIAPGAPGPRIMVTPAPPGHVPLPGPPSRDFALFAQHPHMEGLDEETRELHAKDHEREQTTRQLLGKLQSAESARDRADILDELAQTIEEHFEIRQQIRAKELEALEARVKKLRDLHEKREDAKADIVRQRVEQLVRQAEGLGWSGDHAAFHFEPGGPLFAPATTPTPPREITIRSRR